MLYQHYASAEVLVLDYKSSVLTLCSPCPCLAPVKLCHPWQGVGVVPGAAGAGRAGAGAAAGPPPP